MQDKFSLILLAAGGLVILAGLWFLFGRQAVEPEPQVQTEQQEQQVSGQEQGQVIAQEVEYSNGVAGYLAKPAPSPDGAGAYPAVILIHEWWGLNDDIKSMADRFAEQGYVALAVDMYKGESTTDSARARELSGAVRNDTEGAFENLRSAVDYLRQLPEVDEEKLASVGWCFGGQWSYQMATNNLGTAASVMYYGQFDPEDDFASMRAHILVHFGEEDSSIAIDNVQEFQAALNSTNGMHEVYVYPNVGHGFANERGGTNMAYSKEAAELAWTRTQEFLSKVLNQ